MLLHYLLLLPMVKAMRKSFKVLVLLLPLILSLSVCREKPPKNSIAWDDKGFKINGQYTLFIIGGIQYYRLPPGEWEDRLRKLKAAGVNMVEVYVSWASHEPDEGRFDFTSPGLDLDRFLTLCEKVGLYVYIRPGPYICNETDGGGHPGWLFKATGTKPSASEDGLVVIRRNDADYLKYVERYLARVDAIVRKHQFTINPNGRVLFYALENELDWYVSEELLEGNIITKDEVAGMFRSLRDIVRRHGISIPLTCASGIPPGHLEFIGTGDVEDILIAPNMYPETAASGDGPGSLEGAAARAISGLHDPRSYKGLYVNTPSFVSETDRLTSLLQRYIFGGMDGVNLFNFGGYTVEGYQNGVDLFLKDGKVTQPVFAYFGSQIDYRGFISPRGVLRSTYYTVKRKSEFLNAFGNAIASVGAAKKDGAISVANPDIGTWEDGKRSNYWLETDDGTIFLSLLNQGHYDEASGEVFSPTDQEIGLNGIIVKDVSFPKYFTMTVPYEDILTTPDQYWQEELVNDTILALNLFIGEGFPRLSYSTSEILTLKDFGDRKLLVVYGKAGTTGEIRLTGLPGNPEIAFNSLTGFNLDENGGEGFIFHYVHSPDSFLVLKFPGEKTLQVLVTTIERANRYWFFTSGGQQFMISDLDYLENIDSNQKTITIKAQRRTGPSDVMILTPIEPAVLMDNAISSTTISFTFTPAAMALFYSGIISYALPTLPLINAGTINGEALPTPDDAESSWSGEPKFFEELGINRGHAWYLAEFSSGSTVTTGTIHIDSASDIVSAYLNGTYIGTVLPAGRAMNLPFTGVTVTSGKNTIVFRAQIWGHSIYPIPQVQGFVEIPATILDSKRGLSGKAWISLKGTTIDLTEWNVLRGLKGERDGVYSPDYYASAWQPITITTSLALQDGETLWFRTTFDSSSIPESDRIFAPLLVRLKGKNCMGTIWFNGLLIGRWLSDNNWLMKGIEGSGAPIEVIRDMWLGQEADSLDKFYLPQSYIRDGSNTIVIALEDASNSDYQASPDVGQVDSLEIIYNTDHLDGSAGSLLKSSISITLK